MWSSGTARGGASCFGRAAEWGTSPGGRPYGPVAHWSTVATAVAAMYRTPLGIGGSAARDHFHAKLERLSNYFKLSSYKRLTWKNRPRISNTNIIINNKISFTILACAAAISCNGIPFLRVQYPMYPAVPGCPPPPDVGY